MSILGDKLKQYIDESGYTVYRLSKLSGVNRTSIVRMLNSNRVPERENIERLFPFLKLTPAEKDNVWKLYETSACGEDVFYRREYVLNMLLSLFNSKVIDSGHIPNKNDSLPDIDKKSILEGRYVTSAVETARLMSLLMQSERNINDICIFSPFTSEFTDNIIRLIFSMGIPDMKIRHLVHFVKNPDKAGDVTYNLKVLSKLLPYASMENARYESRYMYINTPVTPDSMVPFPFYMIFGSYLVLISADFETAFFTSAQNIVNYYRSLFEKTSTLSEPLVNSNSSLEAFIERYRNVSTPRVRRYSIELQPPLIDTADLKLLNKTALTDLMDFQEFLELYEKRTNLLHEDKKPVILFSLNGLTDFAGTGRISTLPEQYFGPFPITDRIFLLEKLKLACMHDDKKIRMLNPISFPITNNAIFSLEKDKRVIIGDRDIKEIKYRQIYLTEPTIVESITDFFDYVLEHPIVYSDLIYSREDTLSEIDACISKLCDIDEKNRP